MKNFIKIGLVSILASGVLYAGTYSVDTAHSNVGFKVKHLMISNVKGNFGKFSGTIVYDEKSAMLQKINGEIALDSIDTDNEKRDEHLKSKDFFEIEKYPNIVFELVKTEKNRAYGKLTMHGVTREIVLDVENNGVVKDPWGSMRIGLNLRGKISRKDFGLTYNSVLESGGVAIGDEVSLDVELEGILQK